MEVNRRDLLGMSFYPGDCQYFGYAGSVQGRVITGLPVQLLPEDRDRYEC